MIHFYDHIFVAIIALLFPLYSWFDIRKSERHLAKPGAAPINTVLEYKRSIAWLTGLGLICLVNWVYQTRGFPVLGLSEGSSLLRWAGGLALALAGLVATHFQGSQLSNNEKMRFELKQQLKRFDFMLPRTREQLRWFGWVSLAAGVWEELVYRGFLIWYLQHWMGPIPALLVSSLVFGLAHSYQGPANILRTGLVGLWLGGVYLLSGALWPAMLAHFVFDVINGRMIQGVLSEGE